MTSRLALVLLALTSCTTAQIKADETIFATEAKQCAESLAPGALLQSLPDLAPIVVGGVIDEAALGVIAATFGWDYATCVLDGYITAMDAAAATSTDGGASKEQLLAIVKLRTQLQGIRLKHLTASHS